MKHLTDSQLEALFLGHWTKTRDLTATLRLIADAVAIGEPRAFLRAAAVMRRAAQPASARTVDRGAAVDRGREIVRAFCRAKGVAFIRMTERNGMSSIVRERFEAMWLLRQREISDLSYPEIGSVFGGRDHTVVMRGERRVEERIAADPDLRQRLLALVCVEPTRRAA